MTRIITKYDAASAEHRHVFDVGPSPAAIEDADFRMNCKCGHRQRVLGFRFPYVPTSANVLHRYHYQYVSRLRRKLKDDAMYYAEPQREPFAQAVVSLTFMWSDKYRRDVDNYIAGSKGLIDALVARRWLVDDDAAHMTLEAHGITGTRTGEEVVDVSVTEASW